MHEEIISIKLGLESKFPRALLCIQQKRLGIGLIKLKTAIAMLVHKLYIGNIRVNSKIAKLIKINKEALTIEHSRGGKKNNAV